ncbi:MAG TPA: hypothetical protein VNQ76_18245, partial [Planctomicrobium sp.]|nr:hypothetical protein [Planctomicrobium sp.]
MQRTVSTDHPVRFSGRGFQNHCFLNRFGKSGWLLLIAALGLLFCQASLQAEDEAEAESGQLSFEDDTPPLSDSMSSGSIVTRPHTRGDGPGSGIDGRIGFIGLPTLGRDDSIVPLELFPYVQTEDQILFGDLRAFLTTEGRLGANIGL